MVIVFAIALVMSGFYCLMKRSHKMQINFWRHFNKKDKQYCTLYCRLTMDSKRAEIGSTGVRVRVEQWDETRKIITEDHPESTLLNEKINIFKTRLLNIYNNLFASGNTFDVHDVQREYLNKYCGMAVTLIEAFDEFLKANRKDKDLALSTITKREQIRDKLLAYLIFRKAPRLKIEQFRVNELDRMRAYMQNDLNHMESHIVKTLATVKQVVKWAKVYGYCNDNPLEGVRIKREKRKDPIFCTSAQLAVFRLHKFSHPTMQAVADTFLVYCRTGFHYSDLKKVARNSTSFRKDEEGIEWIYHERIKTGVVAKIPDFIYAETLEIVNKYGGWNKLRFLCNAKMNVWLKLIAAELNMTYPEIDVYPGLSVKHGRCSFSDWLFNEKGYSKEAIRVLMGLKSDQHLDVYARPNERRVKLEYKNLTKKKK